MWAAGDYYVGQGRWPYSGEVIYQTLSLLTWASIPTLFIALFPYRWLRKVLQGLTIFAYSYLLLFESFLVFSYSSLYTDSIALNILATNPGEASAFLENLNYKVFLLPLLVLLVLFALTYVLDTPLGEGSGDVATPWPPLLWDARDAAHLVLCRASGAALHDELPLYGTCRAYLYRYDELYRRCGATG